MFKSEFSPQKVNIFLSRGEAGRDRNLPHLPLSPPLLFETSVIVSEHISSTLKGSEKIAKVDKFLRHHLISTRTGQVGPA